METYRAIAVNTASEAENKIHDDSVATRYGFRAGLVPGVNVYGVLTAPAVMHFGPVWLSRGWMKIRFRQPFFEGEEIRVEPALTDQGTLRLDAERAVAEAGMRPPGAAPEPFSPHPLPAERPLISAGLLRPGFPLGHFQTGLAAAQQRLLAALKDPLPFYAESAHPAVLLSFANEILVRNFVMPAWIHTESEVFHYEIVPIHNPVTVRGRIVDVYNRKGHEMLKAEVFVVNAEGRVVQCALHSAIWKLDPR
jgi:acyl dehydratase